MAGVMCERGRAEQQQDQERPHRRASASKLRPARRQRKALQRALSRQSMPLGLEARNGRTVHNYGNGPGTTRPALA
jgi:hypothetical protein